MRPIVKQLMEKKATKAQIFIYFTAFYLEVIAAVCIIVGLIINFTTVPEHLSVLMNDGNLLLFLTFMFNIVIGIEILKMFCRHDLDSIVEVLLFAVARQVIIEHTTMTENLLAVLAIAVLFSIRKYLFVSALDKKSRALMIGTGSEEDSLEEIHHEEKTAGKRELPPEAAVSREQKN